MKQQAYSPPKSFRRRAKAQQKVEDYYALLDVEETADQPQLKQKYVEKIRQHPPEQQPEAFQAIRKAYDTLRDQERRKQYDIVRRYGESIEDLLEEAMGKYPTKTGRAQALTLLKRAVEIDPQHIQAHVSLAYMQIYIGNTVAFDEQFEILKEIIDVKEWPQTWGVKVDMLYQVGQFDQAYAELQCLKAAYPLAIRQIWEVYATVYESLDREDVLLEEIEAQALAAPVAEMMQLYIVWIKLADYFGDRRSMNRAQGSAKRWIKGLCQPEERSAFSDLLFEEYQNCHQNEEYGTAKLFVDLALSLDKDNKRSKDASRELRNIEGIMHELDRLVNDARMFPLVIFDTMKWLSVDFDWIDDPAGQSEAVPEEAMEELMKMEEAYVAGILHLKKKYPLLYRQYQQRWEDLFKEKTAGMSREERRSLRV